MGLVTYNYDPEYSVEEINIHQHLIDETTEQPSSFSPFMFRRLTTHLKYWFFFFSKNMCEKFCGSRILVIFSYYLICFVSECYLV